MATEQGPGELKGQEIRANPTAAGSMPPVPKGTDQTGSPSPPDLAPILKRVEKLERQRKVMLAISVLAVVIAGLSIWRSVARENSSAEPGKIIEAERIVLLDAAGKRGPSISMDDDGIGKFSFYNAAGVKLATLEEWPKTGPALHLFGPEGKARVSLVAGDRYAGLNLSDSDGRERGRIRVWNNNVWNNSAQIVLSGPNEAESATLSVNTEGPSLSLSGPSVWGKDKEQATATLNVRKDKPALWLSYPNGGTVQLGADQDESSLTLHDAREPRVILRAGKKSNGLTVYGEQGNKMDVSLGIFNGDRRTYPFIEITGADGRTLFEKP